MLESGSKYATATTYQPQRNLRRTSNELPTLSRTTYNSGANTPRQNNLRTQASRRSVASPSEIVLVDLASPVSPSGKTEIRKPKKRLQSPEQGLARPGSHSPSDNATPAVPKHESNSSVKLGCDVSTREVEIDIMSMSLSEKKMEEPPPQIRVTQPDSRNRRKVLSKTFNKECRRRETMADLHKYYVVKMTELKENPNLRKCASLHSVVRLKLKMKDQHPHQRKEPSSPEWKPSSLRTPAMVANSDKGMLKVIKHGSGQYCYASRRYSLMLSKSSGVLIGPVTMHVTEITVRIKPDLYNRQPARDVLSQIKYNFRYQKESTFDSDPSLHSFVADPDGKGSRSIVRNQRYSATLGSYLQVPWFAKGIYLLLKPIYVGAKKQRKEYMSQLMEKLPLLGGEERIDMDSGQDSLEKSRYSSDSADESFDHDERRKMTVNIRRSWYSSGVRAIAHRLAGVVSRPSSGTSSGFKDILKPIRTTTTRRPKRRKSSEQNVFAKLLDPGKALRPDGNLVAEFSDPEDSPTAAGQTAQEKKQYAINPDCIRDVKARINELLRDVIPLDFNKIMSKNPETTASGTRRYGQKMLVRLKRRFDQRDLENCITRLTLMDGTPRAASRHESEGTIVGVVRESGSSWLLAEDFFRAESLRSLAVPQNSELDMTMEKARFGQQQEELCGINDRFREILVASMDNYTQLVDLESYTKEQGVAVRREFEIRDATELGDPESMAPKNTEHIVANERIADPFILDGCGVRGQSTVIRRSYSVTPAADTHPAEVSNSTFVFDSLNNVALVGSLRLQKGTSQQWRSG